MAPLVVLGLLSLVVGLVALLWSFGAIGDLRGLPGSLVEPSGLRGLFLLPVSLLGSCCGGVLGLALVAGGLCVTCAALLSELVLRR